jgi:RNA polymerase sigma-70 factor (ECF subfamily)
MNGEAFITRYQQAISSLWQSLTQRYEVTEDDFARRLQACVWRCVPDPDSSSAAEEITEFLQKVRADELCLALACERGHDMAWRDFETAYRQTMKSAARALTRDEAEAEDLAQSLFGELYGMRVEDGRRISKLSHYSGRGSLGGWLRAVVYQTFIDRHRQTSRFEQLEEVADFDRAARHAAETPALALQNGSLLSSQSVRPDEMEDERLQKLTEQAMTEAFSSLEARERLLLNYYYFDELTLKEIGVILGVHEATISRWLARTQQTVRKKTEELLQRKHGLKRAEISECLQMASRSETELRQIISDAAGTPAERAP